MNSVGREWGEHTSVGRATFGRKAQSAERRNDTISNIVTRYYFFRYIVTCMCNIECNAINLVFSGRCEATSALTALNNSD